MRPELYLIPSAMALTLATHAGRPTATDDYSAFCGAVRLLSRVDLLQYRRDQMERRVRSLADRRGHGSLLDFVAELRSSPDELARLLDRLIGSACGLWREPEEWASIATEVLPVLAAQSPHLRMLSAGCAYGAEAYTLAAIARTVAHGARVEVHGTDIDPRLVARARAGHFSERDAELAPPNDLRRWFEADAEGGWRARSALRACTRFEVGDLLRLRPRSGAYDLIVCRRTAMGFDPAVRDALHARLAEALRPGGFLVVGKNERVSAAEPLGLELVGDATYRTT